MKIDLQLFSEEPEVVDEVEEVEEEKTYTEEEVQELLQKEADRRVSEAQKKFEENYRKKLEKEKEEAKRLAQLTAAEREKELAEQQAKENEELKAELRRIRLESDTKDRLKAEGLDLAFTSMVIGEDAEATNENIKSLKAVFDEAVQVAVNEKFKRPSPTISGTITTSDNPWSQEGFNLTKQGQIMKEDPERAKILMKEAGFRGY